MRERAGFYLGLCLVYVFLNLIATSSVCASEISDPKASFSIGGGYVDAHRNGGVVQLEYKWGRYLWKHWRPQITLLSPMLRSIFLGVGLGFEFRLTERFTVTPSFTPGVYFRAKGLNLGYPLEFRSAIECAYSLCNGLILGIQACHISNAHLGSRNPGMNACIIFCGWQN